jgi:hypothetical protein
MSTSFRVAVISVDSASRMGSHFLLSFQKQRLQEGANKSHGTVLIKPRVVCFTGRTECLLTTHDLGAGPNFY